MEVSELTGALLDYWVAKAEGCREVTYVFQRDAWFALDCGVPVFYSRDWAQGGPIIEREVISIQKDVEDYSETEEPWYADCGVFWDIGATPLIAAMRAYVASRFGGEVEG